MGFLASPFFAGVFCNAPVRRFCRHGGEHWAKRGKPPFIPSNRGGLTAAKRSLGARHAGPPGCVWSRGVSPGEPVGAWGQSLFPPTPVGGGLDRPGRACLRSVLGRGLGHGGQEGGHVLEYLQVARLQQNFVAHPRIYLDLHLGIARPNHAGGSLV